MLTLPNQVPDAEVDHRDNDMGMDRKHGLKLGHIQRIALNICYLKLRTSHWREMTALALSVLRHC